MTPQEVAMKFSSASATCKNGKCPYTAECNGTAETCKMKEVALIIRTLLAELSTAYTKINTLQNFAATICEYMRDLEQINEQYYKLSIAFQNGYRRKSRVKRGRRPKKIPRPRDPVQMDGDKRFEYVEHKTEPDLPVVII